MTTPRRTWPEVVAFVVDDASRTANAAKLLRWAIVGLLVVLATVVLIVVLVLDKASLRQVGIGSGALAVATAAVSGVKHLWASRWSAAAEQAVGDEAGGQDDHRADGDATRRRERGKKKSQSGGKDPRAAVVQRGERPGRQRPDRRTTPR